MDTGDGPKDKKGEFPIQGEMEKGLEENVTEGFRKGWGMSMNTFTCKMIPRSGPLEVCSNALTYKYGNAIPFWKNYVVSDQVDPEWLNSEQAVAEGSNALTYKYGIPFFKIYVVSDQVDPEWLNSEQAVAEGSNALTYKYGNVIPFCKNYVVSDQVDPEWLNSEQAVAEGEPPKNMVAILDPPRSPSSAEKTVQVGLLIPIIVNALEREAGQKHRHTVLVEPDEQVSVLRQLLANKCNVTCLPQHYLFAFKREVMNEDLSFREHGIVSMGGTKIDVVDFPV